MIELLNVVDALRVNGPFLRTRIVNRVSNCIRRSLVIKVRTFRVKQLHHGVHRYTIDLAAAARRLTYIVAHLSAE